jgi:hypothetical protein
MALVFQIFLTPEVEQDSADPTAPAAVVVVVVVVDSSMNATPIATRRKKPE